MLELLDNSHAGLPSETLMALRANKYNICYTMSNKYNIVFWGKSCHVSFNAFFFICILMY